MKATVLILLFSTSLLCQEGSRSLYAKALQACLEKEVAEYSKFSDRNLREVVVAYNFDLTRDLPTQLGGIKIDYLNDYELAERYKALPKTEQSHGVPVIKVFPLYDKEDKLIFAYNNYWFRYSEKGGFLSRKKLMFSWGLEGGCHAYIGFDPKQKIFVIEKVELWGI